MAEEAFAHAEGGARAWAVMMGSFLCNGIIFGLINTYSVLYVQLQDELIQEHVPDASSKAALVGSLAIGTTFFFSPVAGIMTDRIGVRLTTLIGGFLASLGLFLSSFLTHNVGALYLTYGVMFGVGASLAYTPSLVILGHYFRKYLGLVNGFVTMGSSVFTMVMPYLIHMLLLKVALANTIRCLSFLMAGLMLCALLFKPLPQAKIEKKKLESLLNTDIWRNKRYVIWALLIPLALFGYFVPYVHMVKFVNEGFEGEDGKLLVLCIGCTSGIGRLVFGKIADIPNIDRIFLQQVSFVVIGTLTMLMTVTDNFYVLLLIALGMGLFDGCFISLLGPIAFDICGQSGAGQAIGFLLGFCSIPLTVGPPLAGLIYDHTQSYTLPFLLAGIPPIVGGLALSLVRCFKLEDREGMKIDVECEVMNPSAEVCRSLTKNC
ncbi:monocarboxylate transporter 10 isoform X2 [Cimex lectularius]|uniref:Karmoisin n=1 Tax=Cimex lectularius TaxID=79782 RepID=A0A8I6TFH1_CIMLE|nr:monocarboxylate transporter 10 isoform X2 [Cimex lectularius]